MKSFFVVFLFVFSLFAVSAVAVANPQSACGQSDVHFDIKKDNGEFAGRSSSRGELRIQVEKREGDAAMSSPVLDLDAEKPVLDASPRPQRLATVPYGPGPEREGVRTKLAIGSAIVTAGIGITPLLWALIWHNPVNVLLTGIFTPFFGLTGTVVGFL